MSQYRTFTAQDAVEYAGQFGGLDDPSSPVEAQEVGDGNLNLVLKFSTARASAASSLSRRCPTYAASANPPLTLDRARLEAQTPVEHYQHSPQHTVKIHHFDPELAVMVMEDLSSHRIWRGELIRNNYYPQAARQLGNIWLTPFSTPAIFICIRTRKSAGGKIHQPGDVRDHRRSVLQRSVPDPRAQQLPGRAGKRCCRPARRRAA